MSVKSKKTVEFARRLGLVLTPAELEKLDLYAALVHEKASTVNITAARTMHELWERHIADAFPAAAFIRGEFPAGQPLLIADAGAGAGFTGIPLKILLPNAELALWEAVERKRAFLNWTFTKLGLTGISAFGGRVGEKPPKKPADIVIERAMGKIEDVVKPCLSLARKDGLFMAYRQKESEDEKSLLAAAGAQFRTSVRYRLPCDDDRILSVFTKIRD